MKSHPKGFWDNKDNQRKFLEGLLHPLGLSEISELISIPTTKIIEYGGDTLLCKHNNSWIGALKTLYPEHNWKEEKLDNKRKGYWKSKENQIEFLNNIAIKYNITTPQDWGKITTQDIIDNGGKNLLSQYQYSLFRTLEALFPGSFFYSNFPLKFM